MKIIMDCVAAVLVVIRMTVIIHRSRSVRQFDWWNKLVIARQHVLFLREFTALQDGLGLHARWREKDDHSTGDTHAEQERQQLRSVVSLRGTLRQQIGEPAHFDVGQRLHFTDPERLEWWIVIHITMVDKLQIGNLFDRHFDGCLFGTFLR